MGCHSVYFANNKWGYYKAYIPNISPWHSRQASVPRMSPTRMPPPKPKRTAPQKQYQPECVLSEAFLYALFLVRRFIFGFAPVWKLEPLDVIGSLL